MTFNPNYDYWYWYNIRMHLLRRDVVCRYCKLVLDKYTITIDHVVAKSKGGSDDLSNLVASCKHCNGRKSDRPVEEFEASMVADSK